ncbi:MAG: hypothetical protein ACI8PT_001450 [Gammaproteobacteria bacterium]|jgi:hypothetical protein
MLGIMFMHVSALFTHHRASAVMAACALALGATHALAAPEPSAATETYHCRVGAHSMVIHLDPSTGRPTANPMPEQAAAIAALQMARANRTDAGLVIERGPTGGKRVNLRGRYRSSLAGVVDSNKTLSVAHPACAPGAETAPKKRG